jgi:hypothetical protein
MAVSTLTKEYYSENRKSARSLPRHIDASTLEVNRSSPKHTDLIQEERKTVEKSKGFSNDDLHTERVVYSQKGMIELLRKPLNVEFKCYAELNPAACVLEHRVSLNRASIESQCPSRRKRAWWAGRAKSLVSVLPLCKSARN